MEFIYDLWSMIVIYDHLARLNHPFTIFLAIIQLAYFFAFHLYYPLILTPLMLGASHAFVCLTYLGLWQGCCFIGGDLHALRGLVSPMTSSDCRFGFSSVA